MASFPAVITRPADLQRLAEELRRASVLAVDTESNSLYAYREQVCLVQFSTLQEDYLVDPLLLKDLSPLAPLFADAGIEKVFHACEYDVICLRRDFDFEFASLFDTMLAARILGRAAQGLGAILEIEFGLHLDKHGQRADWGARPLPAHLLDYARQDTHYLIPLRERLYTQLQERGLWPLAQEDFARQCVLRAAENNGRFSGEGGNGWRIRGSYDLTPQQAAVLMELCQYRDRQARQVNRPLFKVMGDQTLLSIAAQLPRDLESLSSLPGMSVGQVRRHGAQLLQAVQRGLQAKPVRPPRTPRPDNDFLQRLEALRQWRKTAGQRLEMASDVVLPRDLIYSLAMQNPSTMEELAPMLSEVPWRLEHFGAEILQALLKARQGSRRRK
jgi:ribonuclease D